MGSLTILQASDIFDLIEAKRNDSLPFSEIAEFLNTERVKRAKQKKSWSEQTVREFYYRQGRSRRLPSATKGRGRPRKDHLSNGRKKPTVVSRSRLHRIIAEGRKQGQTWEDIASQLSTDGIIHQLWNGNQWTATAVEEYYDYCEFCRRGKSAGNTTGKDKRGIFLNRHFIRVEEIQGEFIFEVHSLDEQDFSVVRARKPGTPRGGPLTVGRS